jgi:hypothetical protein
MFAERLRTIGLKNESVAGTAETLGGSDYNFRFYGIKYDSDIEELVRNYATSDFSKFSSIMGKRSITISGSLDYVWSGTNSTSPEWSKIIKSCGVKETTYTTTGIGWTPNADYSNVCSTIEIVEKNEGTSPVQIVVKAHGCVGNAKVILDSVGKPIRIDVEFKGVLNSITDRAFASILIPSGFNNTIPEAVLSSTITLFGEAQQIESMTLDFGNKIELIGDPSKAQGILRAGIVDRTPILTLDPYIDLIANRGNFTRFTAGTTGALSVSVGSHLTISAPCAQITKGYSSGERVGFTTNALTCTLSRNAGNDDFELLQGAKA